MADINSGPGWYEVINPRNATTNIALVYEDGSLYLPEGLDTLNEDEFHFAAARGNAHRLVRADEVQAAGETIAVTDRDIDPPHVRAARYAAAGNAMAASLVRDGFGDDEIAVTLHGTDDDVQAPCLATFREDPMPDTVYCGKRGYHRRHTAREGSNYYAWFDGDEGAGRD